MPLGLFHQRLDPIGSVRTRNANLVANLLKAVVGHVRHAAATSVEVSTDVELQTLQGDIA